MPDRAAWMRPQDVFKYLDILVWVEATIYQLDEDNESWAKQGQVYAGRKVLGKTGHTEARTCTHPSAVLDAQGSLPRCSWCHVISCS